MAEPPASADSLYAALLTAAAGVFTTALTLAVGWLHDRGTDSRRTSAVKEAAERVHLLEAWYRTRVMVAPEDVEKTRTLILAELDSAMESVRELETAIGNPTLTAQRQRRLAHLPWIRRWLLLYQPLHPLAWLPRLFFYISVAFTVAVTPALLLDRSIVDVLLNMFVHGEHLHTRMPSPVSLQLLSELILVGTCILARWFAVFTDEKMFRRFMR